MRQLPAFVLAAALVLVPGSGRADIWDRCDLEALWESYLENAKEAGRLYQRAAGQDDAAARGYQQALDAAVEEAKSVFGGAVGDALGGGDHANASGRFADACKRFAAVMNQMERVERAINALIGIQGAGVLQAMAKANRMEAHAAWRKARRDLRRYRECCKALPKDPPRDPAPPPSPPNPPEPPVTGGPISSGGGVPVPTDPVPPGDPAPPDDPVPPPDGGGGKNPGLDGVDDDCLVRPDGEPVSTRARNVPRDRELDPDTTLVKCGRRGKWMPLSRYRRIRGLRPGTRGPSPGGGDDARAAAVRRIRDLIRDYEAGDIGGMLRHLSPDFSQDTGILENAVRNDSRYQSGIRVEVFPGQVVPGAGGVSVRFRWNRTANASDTGAPDGTTGEATFFLSKRHGYKVDRMVGPLPFGVRDQDLVDQTGGRKAVHISTRRPVVCAPAGATGSGNAGSGSSW